MSERYVAFLRGINLGKRRVSKEKLAEVFGDLGFENVKTLIASGNVVFDAKAQTDTALTETVQDGLKTALGFKVDTMIRSMAEVEALLDSEPFAGIEVTRQTRLYVTLLAAKSSSTLKLPHVEKDGALQVLSRTDREVFAVVTISEGRGTIDAMELIEKEYGKAATTRNWNTIQKLRGM